MNERPIGIFDSGQGGLTVVRELIRLLPAEHIVYFGDTGRLPYGTKNRRTITQYATQDISFLRQHDVKMVIAACGTVSAILPDEITKKLPVPYTGVLLPAAKRAVEQTKTGRICGLGTPATIRSEAYTAAISDLLPGATVLGIACPLFVPLVENGYTEPDCAITRLAAKEYLAPALRFEPDVIILGCTHFPLLAPLLRTLLPPEIQLVDPGAETARYTEEMLRQKNLKNPSTTPGIHRFYVSDDVENFTKNARLFLGQEIVGKIQKAVVDIL